MSIWWDTREEWRRGDSALPRTGFYSDLESFLDGWPFAASEGEPIAWPIHCYGYVGVGRNVAPDTGTGAELYTIIGQPQRHMDRNLAVVGRVIAGMEHLSSLPRGHARAGVLHRGGSAPAHADPVGADGERIA